MTQITPPQPVAEEDQNPYNLPPGMNRHMKKMIEQIMKTREQTDQILRLKGKEDLYIFNRFVLGVEQNGVKLAQCHKELCYFITDNKKKKKLLLIPRGHLKSTLVTIGYSVQSIINNPNIRILILNATWQMAVDFLTEIKRNLTSNETLIRLFGNLAENPTEWSQDRITLNRTATNIKGPTVWAAGIDSNLVGSHPDLIIFDDPVNRDNSQTREMMEKVILRYKDALDLLEPGGQLIVIGTRWSDADFYSWIMDPENNVIGSYEVMVKQAYTGDLITGENFQALWPEKFNQKELRTRLREKAWYDFSCQYLNNPVPDEDATFKKSWFQYYDFEENRGKQMQTILTIDPAISMKKEADYTGMVVSGIDQFSNIFIKDLARGHWTPAQIINAIFYLNELWHPNQIVIETIAYQKALAYYLNDEMRRRNKFLPIVEKNYQENSKHERIKGLQPAYMNKKVYHRKDLKLNPYFEEELTRFPRGKHDDLIDPFSMALDYLIVPRKPQNRFHHRYLY